MQFSSDFRFWPETKIEQKPNTPCLARDSNPVRNEVSIGENLTSTSILRLTVWFWQLKSLTVTRCLTPRWPSSDLDTSLVIYFPSALVPLSHWMWYLHFWNSASKSHMAQGSDWEPFCQSAWSLLPFLLSPQWLNRLPISGLFNIYGDLSSTIPYLSTHKSWIHLLTPPASSHKIKLIVSFPFGQSNGTRTNESESI